LKQQQANQQASSHRLAPWLPAPRAFPSPVHAGAASAGRGRGCGWRAQPRSPPLRHSVGRRDTLPLSSMARRRPATGAGDAVCGREESRPRGPLPSVDRRRPAAEAGGAARRGPSFLSVTRRQPASGAARRVAGRGGAGEGGSVGMPLHAAGRSWPDRRPRFF